MTINELRSHIRDAYTPEIKWEDAYGQFVDIHTYIDDVTPLQAWDYLEDIFNLPEWTMSVRDVQPMSDHNGMARYTATENLPPFGPIYFLEEKHPDLKTIDWWVGHDPEDIWMRYSMRILDAQSYMGRPGAVFTWVNFGHENFWSNDILMQGFLQMKPAHQIEQNNFVKILKWRVAGNAEEPLTPEKMKELDLINVATVEPPEMLWQILVEGVTESVPWEVLYGDFVGSHAFLRNVQAVDAASYVLDPHNLQDWTVSLRNLALNDEGSFRAVE